MNRLPVWVLAALALAACGDNAVGTTCGAGTVATNGECVPDGSMVCAQGTKYDVATATCVVDPTACGEGTALLNGVCVADDDALAADLQEAAEPNDSSGAGQFNVPALDAAVTLHGCVTPTATGGRDFDPWLMHADGPTTVEITSDGVHGLSGGFVVLDSSGNPLLADFRRFGVNLTGDTSQRQVFLPAAGDYVLAMDDTRALLFGTAAGSAKTCYFGTIKHVATPVATAFTFPSSAGADSGKVRILSFDATATGDILDLALATTSTTMIPSMTIMRKGALVGVANGDAQGTPAFWTLAGFDTTNDQAQVVIDPVYNYGLVPQAYSLATFRVATQALPVSGSTVTTTSTLNNPALPSYLQQGWYYFDVATAGQIENFALSSSVNVRFAITRQDLFTPAGSLDNVVATTATAGPSYGNVVRFAKAGRYYVRLITTVPAGTTFTVTNTLTQSPTIALTYGTAMTAQTLSNASAYYAYTTQATQKWAKFGVSTPVNWGGATAKVVLYDLAGEGELGSALYPAVQTVTVPFDSATGRIVLNDTKDYLVRVQDTFTPAGAASFTLDAGERAFTDLGALTAGTSATRTADTAAANDVHRYLLTTAAGNVVTVTVHPTTGQNPIAARLSIAEAELTPTTAAAGVDDVLTFVQDASGFSAFEVKGTAGAAQTYDVTYAIAPPFYTKHAGTTAFADACTGGATVALSDTDEGLSTAIAAPAGFTFYGAATTQMVIGSNGFISFDPAVTNKFTFASNFPTATKGSVSIAPFWDDLENVAVCTKTVAGKVVVQWTGDSYQTLETVQFQAILDPTDDSIEFVYGPNQAHTGHDEATAGAQSLDGVQGTETGNGLSGTGFITANSAVKLTHP
ncbi:hypothetical protein BH11MYX1_BH11MYX1_49990 [soil metagenome]